MSALESADSLKQLLYAQYIRFLHMHESLAETELDQFLVFAQRESINNFPQSITAIHVIDCIGRHEPVNSTTIAEILDLSKASITKIGGRLLKDGLVNRTQKDDNKKESYFQLTPQGKKIFDLHAQLHEIEAQRFYRFVDKYSAAELQLIRKFLQEYNVELELRLTEGVAE
ncbi:MarR family transcriptional regulator [Paenibacillus sp. HW567]|uniref:MarR family transcriptional regulator n=1 Tax=Paenibacillus sp. HW567 TaxID=1034769 RepID=UPI00037CCFC3|nr:MarR family transcriptional regulator [Paenibacillus sp. HW567]